MMALRPTNCKTASGHCSHVMLSMQWKYITANTCNPPGYADYFGGINSQSRVLPNSYWSELLPTCQLPYPRDGERSAVWPEQFFNCAEGKYQFLHSTLSCLVLPLTIAALVRKVSIVASASIPSTPSIPTPSFPYTAAPTIPIVFTAAPTPPDTPRSELPTMKPTVSDKETEDACCSFDYKTCIKWCGTTKDECLECASSTRWLAQGSMASSNCKARWDGCMGDAKCCPGLVCVQFSKWYGQCSPE